MRRTAIFAGLLVVLGGMLFTVLGQEPATRSTQEVAVGRYVATGIGDGRVVLMDTATGTHYVKNYGALTGGPFSFE